MAKYNSKDFSGAIADFNRAIEIDSNQSSYYVNRGQAKYELKDYMGALADYKKAIEIDPRIKIDPSKVILILFDKPNKTLAERIFVTKFIDELFPNFVDRENNKIYDLINKTNNTNIQDILLGSIVDINKTDEQVAAQLKKALGIEVSPESVRLIRNREPEFSGKIEVPVIKKDTPTPHVEPTSDNKIVF